MHKRRPVKIGNLYGTDPSIIDRFFSQAPFKGTGKRFISAACRRKLDAQLEASYAAVGPEHDAELLKLDSYSFGLDGQLVFTITSYNKHLSSGRQIECPVLYVKEKRHTAPNGNDVGGETFWTLDARRYLTEHVFQNNPLYQPFINDLMLRMEQFARGCQKTDPSVIGVDTPKEFTFNWFTDYMDEQGPHSDGEPSLLLHVGGELPDGTKVSRGAGVIPWWNFHPTKPELVLNPRKVMHLRPGDFAVCAGGIQGKLKADDLKTRPEKMGGAHTNAARFTDHPKQPELPKGSRRRSLVSYGRYPDVAG